MSEQQIIDMLHIMVNMTTSLSKISVHMEQIVEKLDSIDNNVVYLGATLQDIKEDEIS